MGRHGHAQDADEAQRDGAPAARSGGVGLSGSGLVTVAVVALVALLPAMTSPVHRTSPAAPPAVVASDTTAAVDPSDPATTDDTDPAVDDPSKELDPASSDFYVEDPLDDPFET